jgi:hypothetical protein
MAYTIRPMHVEEIALAADWAAAEGWNPGLSDAACFATVDPHGFLIGERDGEPAATISCVNYDDRFSFLGFYIVRPDVRGSKSGFSLAYRNVRYGGRVTSSGAAQPLTPLADVPLAIIAADDATVFPASRLAFLRAWIGTSGHTGRALMRDGKLAAWGVIRPCRAGFKIGPLVADDRAAAEAVFDALIAVVGGGEVFLDLPEPNKEAQALAQSRGLQPVFETARMYKGEVRAVAVRRIFGVTTFELG